MINKKLLSDIESYCKLNDLEVEKFINKLLRNAFTVEKYGDEPKILKEKKEPIIEEPVKEIVEKIIEPEKNKTDIYGE